MSLLLAGQLAQIDWQAPWFASYSARGRLVAEAVLAALSETAVTAPGAVARALNRCFAASPIALSAGPLRAEPQARVQATTTGQEQATVPAARRGPEAYESRIARTACLPVRDDLHDFFNGLVWLHQPQLKARLNALQAAEIAQRGIGAVRGPVRDALTRFDESGGLWRGPPDLLAAWRERRWADFLWHSRARWPAEARFEVFGHALLAQLATAPRPGLTAHALIDLPLAWSAAEWTARPLLPLPVAGVPGWWPGQGIGFYADAAVFRPLHAGVARA